MLIPYPLSTKHLAKMLKQILACALLVWPLLEVNLTVEKKKHRCLKQKVGDRKIEHARQAICWMFFLSSTCEQKPSKALISISVCMLHQDAFISSPFNNIQEQQIQAAYLGQRIYFGLGEDE